MIWSISAFPRRSQHPTGVTTRTSACRQCSPLGSLHACANHSNTWLDKTRNMVLLQLEGGSSRCVIEQRFGGPTRTPWYACVCWLLSFMLLT